MDSVLRVAFLALLLIGSVSAMSDAEVKAEFSKLIMSCMKDHPVEMNDLLQLKALTLPNSVESKCLLACAYRRLGTLNDEGTFELEKAYKIAENTKAGDEKAIAKGKQLADICNKVNDVAVSDGSKGCQRAGLMFMCVIHNAPKLGFTV